MVHFYFLTDQHSQQMERVLQLTAFMYLHVIIAWATDFYAYPIGDMILSFLLTMSILGSVNILWWFKKGEKYDDVFYKMLPVSILLSVLLSFSIFCFSILISIAK